MMRVFTDRVDAGESLAEELLRASPGLAAEHDRVVVLGLARGGVPVARVVAETLGARLDALVVGKLGAPGNPEFAMGAVAGGGHIVVNDDVPARLGVSAARFEEIVARETAEVADREHRYRGGRPPTSLTDQIVVLVDDGLATGSTMAVAIEAVRAGGARRVIVAVPTAPRESLSWLARRADDVVCVSTPEPFDAVGSSYRDFTQVADDEVRRALGTG